MNDQSCNRIRKCKVLEVVSGYYKVHNPVSLNIIKGILAFPQLPPFHGAFKLTFLIVCVNFFFFFFLFRVRVYWKVAEMETIKRCSSEYSLSSKRLLFFSFLPELITIMHHYLLSHILLTYIISVLFNSVPTLQKYLWVEKTNVRKVRNVCECWQNVTPNPVIITLPGLYLKCVHPSAHLCIHLFMR